MLKFHKVCNPSAQGHQAACIWNLYLYYDYPLFTFFFLVNTLLCFWLKFQNDNKQQRDQKNHFFHLSQMIDYNYNKDLCCHPRSLDNCGLFLPLSGTQSTKLNTFCELSFPKMVTENRIDAEFSSICFYHFKLTSLLVQIVGTT